MKQKLVYTAALIVILLITALSFTIGNPPDNDIIISYIADPRKQDIQLYWKDDSGQLLKSIQNLKDHLQHKNKQLVFAMNGGMFMTNNVPLGLFIQQQQVVTALNTASGEGNFYLKPNGVFFITSAGKAGVCTSLEFADKANVKWATQSGPMLLINGAIHPAFKEGSANLNIRNGVGILPDNRIVFAMSKKEINFYDFALFFKNLGCKNALYLDGFVSRMYLPEKGQLQTDGDFGVIIGISE